MEVVCPEYSDREARPAMIYVRPHEVDINRTAEEASSLRAKVAHINPAGSVTGLELHAPELGLEIHVEVSPARYAELYLKIGEMVYISPRRSRVFVLA